MKPGRKPAATRAASVATARRYPWFRERTVVARLRIAAPESSLLAAPKAALALVSDMENTFGYKQEAADFRQEINKHRQDVVRRQINDAIGQIDTFCSQEKWSEALREAERLWSIPSK